jgi:hypothetical protein
MRRALPALMLLLAACTDEGVNPIVGAAFEELNPFRSGVETPPAPAQPVTRAAIDHADVATIRIRLIEEENGAFMFAASDNGGYVTYASSLRQSLTLRGSQVTGSRGLGYDLLSAWSSQPDPVMRAIPPGQWPARVTRNYEFPAPAPQGRIETFECRFELGAVSEMVIIEQRHRGVEISEYCAGPSGEFENLHFADLSTGFVWRSIQWLGPQQGLLDLQIVLPYTGRRG